jgi:hypothetical protein
MTALDPLVSGVERGNQWLGLLPKEQQQHIEINREFSAATDEGHSTSVA